MAAVELAFVVELASAVRVVADSIAGSALGTGKIVVFGDCRPPVESLAVHPPSGAFVSCDELSYDDVFCLSCDDTRVVFLAKSLLADNCKGA